jgi:hypothetical protein
MLLQTLRTRDFDELAEGFHRWDHHFRKTSHANDDSPTCRRQHVGSARCPLKETGARPLTSHLRSGTCSMLDTPSPL